MESRSQLLSVCQTKKRKTCVSVVALAVTIGCVLFAFKAFGEKPKDPSLKKVFIVFRHGDRNPTETYPNDPHVNHLWPGGWGALTKLGMKQMYTLGQWVRSNYGYVTDHTYVPGSVVVNSSYADRCIMSTQAMLAGLYPQDEEEAFVQGLPWRPIPVHYLPRELDQVLVVKKPCPKLDAALEEAYRNESLRSDEESKSYYENLTRHTGQMVKTVTDVEFLYNTLEIEEKNGLVLPEWTKQYYNAKMRELAARSYTLFTSNALQQRLRGGPLLKHILDNMRGGKKEEKIFLYGTHDLSIVNTLRAMGFVDELFKLDVGATLIYELRVARGGQSRVVHISMLNNTEQGTPPHSLKIPGCESDPCLLDELFDVWSDVLPNDWDEECKA
ncbi:lysosomal acid phosphatase-like [Copidosoma floridanum]|uniref:lysosomal acid phosphatase-like n=1 Tax=Copidosoma floridanum TaxID=29053 RepID=UPI0006C9B15C|nr:lysosomal acid phosphatase-like [Copidosoma floridanum]